MAEHFSQKFNRNTRDIQNDPAFYSSGPPISTSSLQQGQTFKAPHYERQSFPHPSYSQNMFPRAPPPLPPHHQFNSPTTSENPENQSSNPDNIAPYHHFGNQSIPPPSNLRSSSHMPGSPGFHGQRFQNPNAFSNESLPHPPEFPNNSLSTRPPPPFNPRLPPPPLYGQRLPAPSAISLSDNRLPAPHHLFNQRPPLPHHLIPPPLQTTDIDYTSANNSHNTWQPKQHKLPPVDFNQINSSQIYNQLESSPGLNQPLPYGAIKQLNSSEHVINQSANIGMEDEYADHQWLTMWLKTHKIKIHKDDVNRSPTIKIPEAKSILKNICILVDQLKSISQEINAETFDETEKPNKLRKADEIKENLDYMKSVMNNNYSQSKLNKKIADRRRVRERKKQKKDSQYKERLKKEEERRKMHELIDEWQEDIYNKVQETKRENELKTIADKTLAEVRRKSNDVKRGLELLHSLQKLRSVRKDSMERKGLYTPKDSDYMFEARLRMQKEILEKQLKTYEAENRLIQVMLDTEQQECKEYEEEEIQRTKEEKEKQLELSIREILFGKESLKEPIQPTHPLYRFRMYHDAANFSEQNLCSIRQEWDAYIVDETSLQGSSLPQTWVIPKEPANEAWASVLKS